MHQGLSGCCFEGVFGCDVSPHCSHCSALYFKGKTMLCPGNTELAQELKPLQAPLHKFRLMNFLAALPAILGMSSSEASLQKALPNVQNAALAR